MVRKLKQFYLLLWKNYVIQKRKIFVTCVELVIPIMCTLLLIYPRIKVEVTNIDHVSTWHPFNPTSFLGNGRHSLRPQFTNQTTDQIFLKIGFSPNNNLTNLIMDNVCRHLKLSTCKGEGFDKEGDLVNFLLVENSTMNNTKTYIGGIVFTELDSNHVSFKVRLSYITRLSKNSFDPSFSNQKWDTKYMFPIFQKIGPRSNSSADGGKPGYLAEGFLAMQTAVSRSITEVLFPIKPDLEFPDITLERYPYPKYINDQFVLVLQNQLPLLLVLSFVFTALQITRDVVHEKETKLKETMKIMGVRGWIHWAAWYVKYIIFLTIACVIITIICKIPVAIDTSAVVDKGQTPVTSSQIMSHINPLLLFLFLLLYASSIITFSFAVSVFFKKANTGAAAGGILFFCSYIPYFFIQQRYQMMNLPAKLAVCFIPNVAMSFGGRLIGSFEGIGDGIQFSNLNTGPDVDDTFTMLHVYIMLLIDTILYMTIAAYFEALFPGEFGVAQPWYFPIMPSYWCGPDCCRSRRRGSERLSGGDGFKKQSVSKDFEPEPVGIEAGIQINNLSKSFGRKVAVENISLNMYVNQVTALLGHNGAGKTTTMSMLTGFIPSSSGSALVNGYDIKRDISQVRKNIGLCPQHDVLFDTLTVEEHLHFFGKLKGLAEAERHAEMLQLLSGLCIDHKRHAQSFTLSGGQKRKLSVCIALMAKPKVIILDEPTSGMDPSARRQTWDLLKEYKSDGRTILLTTHYMEEADYLGDRIAIMRGGVVKCCGSSLFLKNRFGAGYHLTVVKEDKCDVKQVTKVIKGHVADCELESNAGLELSYILPSEQSPHFEALFNELEENKEDLNIAGFGASVTTMQEVFIKVGEVDLETTPAPPPPYSEENGVGVTVTGAGIDLLVSTGRSDAIEADLTDMTPVHGSGGSSTTSSNISPGGGDVEGVVANNINEYIEDDIYSDGLSDIASLATVPSTFEGGGADGVTSDQTVLFRHTSSPKQISRISSVLHHLAAQFKKRILYTKRTWLVTGTQLAVPLFFTIMALTVIKTLPKGNISPPLPLDLSHFKHPIVSFQSANETNDALMRFQSCLTDYFKSSHVPLIDVDKQPITFNDSGDVTLTRLQKYLLQKASDDIASFNARDQISLDLRRTEDEAGAGRLHIKGLFNAQSYHSIAISLASVLSNVACFLTGSHNYSISATNEPLPPTDRDKFAVVVQSGTLGFTIAFNVVFGVAFLASSFVIFLIKERESKAKHLQLISGVRPLEFWLTTFIWDLANFIIPSLLLVLTFFAFDIEAYYKDNHWLDITLLFFLYGCAMLPFMYLWSFGFHTSATGFVWAAIFNILSGLATLLTVDILDIPGLDLEDVANSLDWVFVAILPNYNLAKGLQEFYMNYEISSVCNTQTMRELCAFKLDLPCCQESCKKSCLHFTTNVLSWTDKGIGKFLVFLSIQSVVFWLIIFSLESGVLHFVKSRISRAIRSQISGGDPIVNPDIPTVTGVIEDSDVVEERRRVLETPLSSLQHTDSLILKSVSKFYSSTAHAPPAVDRLTFGVRHSSCFGLLGLNGAGKTSTFKMITGDELISLGEAYLHHLNIEHNISTVRRMLGYCPQFDALLDHMTGRETLEMFARLRDVPTRHLTRHVNALLHNLALTEHADKLTKVYSGGNKRKLSAALALIGNPTIVLLDEPTSGVDPVARRLLWKTFCRVRNSGRTLILTSHSMEECDALCTNIAIMVNGQIKCFGSPQHLKTKFGDGYSLMARIGPPPLPPTGGSESDEAVVGARAGSDSVLDINPLRIFIEETFPGAVLKDTHQGLVHYHIKNDRLKWGQIFGEMERAKEKFHIEDYSVSQTSLEQVFLSFANSQIPPNESNPSCTCCQGCC